MTAIYEISSGVSNSLDSESRKVVDYVESIGRPDDPAATSQSATNSLFALLKGCLDDLGVPAGSGDADVNDSGNILFNPIGTLGDMTDTAAADVSSTASAVSLTKRVLSLAGL